MNWGLNCTFLNGIQSYFSKDDFFARVLKLNQTFYIGELKSFRSFTTKELKVCCVASNFFDHAW